MHCEGNLVKAFNYFDEKHIFKSPLVKRYSKILTIGMLHAAKSFLFIVFLYVNFLAVYRFQVNLRIYYCFLFPYYVFWL